MSLVSACFGTLYRLESTRYRYVSCEHFCNTPLLKHRLFKIRKTFSPLRDFSPLLFSMLAVCISSRLTISVHRRRLLLPYLSRHSFLFFQIDNSVNRRLTKCDYINNRICIEQHVYATLNISTRVFCLWSLSSFFRL